MYGSGLLILSPNVHSQKLSSLLKYVRNIVNERLFFTIPQSPSNFIFWKKAATLCYTTACKVCPSLNVCLLLPSSEHFKPSVKFDIVISPESEFDRVWILNEVHNIYPLYDNDIIYATKDQLEPDFSLTNDHVINTFPNKSHEDISRVCLGGTFDRLHYGHKILLTIGALLAKKHLLVGVTCSDLLSSKCLCPLIFSWEKRSRIVQSFLSDIGVQSKVTQIVRLSDKFGPPGYSAEFDCIVASSDSLNNCKELNELRRTKGFEPLKIELIDFIYSDRISFNECKSCPFDPSDFKLCSSKLRFNELGNLLKPVNNINFDDSPCSPYLIGLTGPSGSGKSSLAKRLKNLSEQIHIIDCDRLGHEAYTAGTPCHQALLSHFGRENIASPEPPYPIDRSLLGRLVFSDPTLLKDLNSIVWPEILRKILTIVEEIKYKALEQDQNHKRPVIILDAAVLLQAKWDKMCHEVWLTVLPQSEAQRRLCERNNLSPKAASERLERQASAVAEVTGGYTWFEAGQYHSYKSPIDYAHVILSTEWDPECSQYQVEKSWKALQQRL
ncbi:Bifunctional coenzyme A synthase [Schistosoma japonicum]|uniref:Bifunctional coenzyme A synthase n=2 Tax=Schistosoma japonicum TaxID=6182 RepID=A0A4Z2CXL1_SCHJA|nr:Bifunctional coenzyme A synthase [Schistosoma japonicum]TNN08996.1 Bifunctional coenzyme A synthase [Schistosoma japonicum]TNN08997.1 Bifunctional coenzyme A synthase [Schistosoma japonicum]